MHLQRANGCHNHRRIGGNPGGAALNVEELFGAHVGAKASLGHHDLARSECGTIGNDRVIAMGNVGKRTGMHERRAAFECLQQVRLNRVTQERGHGSGDFQIFCRDGFSINSFGDHNAAKARAQIGKI